MVLATVTSVVELGCEEDEEVTEVSVVGPVSSSRSVSPRSGSSSGMTKRVRLKVIGVVNSTAPLLLNRRSTK